MVQRAFTVAGTLCAIVCVGTAALWIRSHNASDYFICRRGDRGVSLISEDGVLRWTAARYRFADPEAAWGMEHFSTGGGDIAGWVRLIRHSEDPLYRTDRLFFPDRFLHFDVSFGVGTFSGLRYVVPDGQIKPDFRYVHAIVPHWFLVTVTALSPAAWATRRLRSRRRFRQGRCQACGYDLRATPDRCPECGRVCAVSRPAQPALRAARPGELPE